MSSTGSGTRNAGHRGECRARRTRLAARTALIAAHLYDLVAELAQACDAVAFWSAPKACDASEEPESIPLRAVVAPQLSCTPGTC